MITSLEDFQLIYNNHSGFIRAVLFRLVGPQLLDDAVQECFLKAWKSRNTFKGESSVKTWLFTIAKNTAYDLLRKKKPNLDARDFQTSTIPVEENLKEDIQNILLTIPLDFRVVLVSVIFEEMTLKEVTESLGIPEGTVKSRLSRGREMLQKELKSKGYDYGK